MATAPAPPTPDDDACEAPPARVAPPPQASDAAPAGVDLTALTREPKLPAPKAAGVASLHGDVLAPLGLGVLVVVAAVGIVAALMVRIGGPVVASIVVCAPLFTAVLLGVIRGLMSRSAGTPLERLRAALQEIEEGNYDARLEPSGARELHDLAHGFNRMATIVGHQRERLKALAATDLLTGVANHRHFHEQMRAHLKRSEYTRSPVSVVMLDVDHFKRVNELFGHSRGDDALRTVATALSNAVRSTDLVARVGGDDFALLLPGADPGYAREVADRAREAIARVSPRDLLLSASAGFACHPVHTEGDHDLGELAVAALNLAKEAGGDQTRKFDAQQVASLPTLREQRAEILTMLEHRDPITPVFQPIVELSTGTVAGYEALSRFQDSDRSPDAWFNQAARCGLGARLEAEAIRAALEAPGRPKGTYLSLNFSPSALASRRVRTVLPRDLSDVVIEITEHELAAEDSTLEQSLMALRNRGARIAVDDAGAGYAGLQQVMRVQPDIIKLDRGLIEKVDIDPAKAALVEFFVLFAERVDAKVCTEGIETREELSALVSLNVSYGQGYFLGRPAETWTGLTGEVAKALSVGSLRGHEQVERPPHVLGPVNRRLQRFTQPPAGRGGREHPRSQRPA